MRELCNNFDTWKIEEQEQQSKNNWLAKHQSVARNSGSQYEEKIPNKNPVATPTFGQLQK